MIEGFKSGSCYKTIPNKLGYRYELVSGGFPQTAKLGTGVTFSLSILNSGYASVYNKRTVYLVLRNIAIIAYYIPSILRADFNLF